MKPGNLYSLAAIVVAPRAGAWIETKVDVLIYNDVYVAPRAGAWIETYQFVEMQAEHMSPPARGRGLKR